MICYQVINLYSLISPWALCWSKGEMETNKRWCPASLWHKAAEQLIWKKNQGNFILLLFSRCWNLLSILTCTVNISRILFVKLRLAKWNFRYNCDIIKNSGERKAINWLFSPESFKIINLCSKRAAEILE